MVGGVNAGMSATARMIFSLFLLRKTTFPTLRSLTASPRRKSSRHYSAVVEDPALFRGFSVRFFFHDRPLPVILPPEELSPVVCSERRQTPRHTTRSEERRVGKEC